MYSPLEQSIDLLHKKAGDEHHLVSPMGLWLLMAAASTITDPGSKDRRRIEKFLGLPVEQASAVVEELLNSGENTEALKASIALWVRGTDINELKQWAKTQYIDISDPTEEDIYQWQDSLKELIETGPMPSAEEADEWVNKNTDGLIQKMPITIDDDFLVNMVTALATKTSWRDGFREVDNNNLLDGAFKDASKALISHQNHKVYVEDTEIGLVGVHAAYGTNGLVVYSVIADEDIDYDEVIKTAHLIASHDADENQGLELHRLETQDASFYTVEDIESTDGDIYSATLPKWKANTSVKELEKSPELNIGGIVQKVSDKTGIAVQDILAMVQQDVVAEYTAKGFDAAAVTQMAMIGRATAFFSPASKAKLLNVKFSHPYAVVAVIKDGSSWCETPVFSGWVKEVL